MVKGLAVCSLVICLGCAGHAPAQDAPGPPELYFSEQADPLLKLCVPISPLVTTPIVCMTLQEMRALLRSRRFVAS